MTDEVCEHALLRVLNEAARSGIQVDSALLGRRADEAHALEVACRLDLLQIEGLHFRLTIAGEVARGRMESP